MRIRCRMIAATLAALAGCGGSKSIPTTSTPTVIVPGLVGGLTGKGLETPNLHDGSIATFVNRRVTVTWPTTVGATSYILEIGSQPGTSDALSTETNQTTAEWTPPATGDFVAQVKAKNSAGTGPASTQMTIHVVNFRSMVESLYFGSGPYSDPANRGCPSDRMSGWPAGTDIRIVLSTDLQPAGVDGARNTAAQLADATGGVVRAHTDPPTQSKPVAAPGEISVSPIVTGSECSAGASGCTRVTRYDRGVIGSADIFVNNTALGGPGPHEIGHAAFGFCHVLNARNGTVTIVSHLTVMGFGGSGQKLTESDLLVVRSVYDAGLRGGASRSDFVRAGLIDP